MVQLEARKENGNVIISEDSFEHLLNCLDNQKFVGDFNADALTLSKEEFYGVQAKNQAAIDDFNHRCRALLRGRE